MNSSDDELPFEGMTVPQRHQAALEHTTAVAKELVPFLVSILRPAQAPERNRELQRGAVDRGLEESQVLLNTLLLGHLLAAGIELRFDPPLPIEAPYDARNLRAIQEGHFLFDWLAEIMPPHSMVSDSIDAIRADFKRLEQRHVPRTLRRNRYVDPRERDDLELADREFAVLLTYFVAGARQLKIPALLEKLSVRVEYETFRKWARKVDREQRKLMLEAGGLSTAGGGLPLARAARLSKRSQDVLLRDDPGRFPALAGLSDEEKLSSCSLGRCGQGRLPDRVRKVGNKSGLSSHDIGGFM